MGRKGSESSEVAWAIEKILKSGLDGGAVKPPPGQFERIIRNLEIQRGKKRLKNMARKFCIACAALLVLSAGLYGFFPEKLTQGGRKLVSSVTYFIAGGVNIQVFNEDHPLYPAFDEGALKDFRRLKDLATFAVKLPGYRPPDYRVSGAYGQEGGGGFALTLEFRRGGERFFLTQGDGNLFLDPAGRGPGKAVDIGGLKGFTAPWEEGGYFLEFRDGRGVDFLLAGDLEEEELLKVATSLK